MKWFIQALKKYVDFSGRARRQEYWMFLLFYMLFLIAAMIIDGILMASTGTVFSPLTILVSLAMILPSLAVSVRRMHDLGKSGAMIFVPMIPVIGSIWYLILTVTEGQAGDNQYGPDPKGVKF